MPPCRRRKHCRFRNPARNMSMASATVHSLKRVILAALGMVTGILVLSLLPMLMQQTSLRHDRLQPRQIRLIARIPEPFVRQQQVPEEDEPEPPPPPEPEIELKPPEIPDLVPPEVPDIPPIEPELSEPASEPVEMQPFQLQQTRVITPPLSAPSVRGVPVKAAIGPNFRHVKAPAPKSMPPPKPNILKKPANRIRFNLNEVDKAPSGLSMIQPVYPFRARRRGIEGHVAIRFLVDREGKVQSLSILEAEPKNVFETSVRSTVTRWKFNPAQKDGRPVETWVQTTISFKLNDE